MDRMKLLEEFFAETMKIMREYGDTQGNELMVGDRDHTDYPEEEEYTPELLALVKTKFHELYLDTLRTREELERLPI